MSDPEQNASIGPKAETGFAPSNGSAASTSEKVAILAMHLVMYSMVLWYDKRLLVAWICYGMIKEIQNDIRSRKQQNDQAERPGP